MAVVLALAFMLMPVAQVNAQSTGITGAVENVGTALSGMVEGLTNTLSSDFIMSIVESISMRIGRVFGAGLFVASTDNIFFRVLEWIVGFSILILSQIVYEILAVVYIIPVVSCAGSITQPLIFFEVMIPLLGGLPFIFADSTESGIHSLTYGASLSLSCLHGFLGFLLTTIGGICLHGLYAILIPIPLLNIIVSIINLLLAGFFWIIFDIIVLIFSVFSFLQNLSSRICTDCVIIARAMCRACLGV